MRKCNLPCEIACPVQLYLKGEENGTLSFHDGSVAEEIAATTPNAANVIREGCELGTPTKPLLGLGRLACSSTEIKDHFSSNNSYTAEVALRMSKDVL